MSQNLENYNKTALAFFADLQQFQTDSAISLNGSRPFVMEIDVSDLNLTDEQFERFSKQHSEYKFEMNQAGKLIVTPSSGFISGVKSSKLSFSVALWTREDDTGIAAGSSTMFVLPNGAKRSPNVSWVRNEKLQKFTVEELQNFAPFAPDFVIELRSPTDSLRRLQEKMREYIENGVSLG